VTATTVTGAVVPHVAGDLLAMLLGLEEHHHLVGV
jgi:hypothetical protein